MKKLLIALMAVAASAVAMGGETEKKATLEYLGHAAFILTSPGGTRILMDPYKEGMGYSVEKVKADAVTVSHDHFDHNNVGMAEGSPKIIRGLTQDGDWAKVDETVGDVKIRSVGSLHWKDEQFKDRGKNAVMVFETGGLRIVHLGDLGRLLTPEQVKTIGQADVLLIPVGGFYTIDAKEADEVIAHLNPKAVIPMHYLIPGSKLPIAGVEVFLQGKDNVLKTEKSVYEVGPLPEKTTIVALKPGREI